MDIIACQSDLGPTTTVVNSCQKQHLLPTHSTIKNIVIQKL